MPIEIKELSNGVTHVEWKTKVKHLSGNLSKDFRLKRYHPKMSYCVEFNLFGELIRGTKSSYKVEISLLWPSSTDMPKNIQHQPRSIWVSLNKGVNKFRLKKEKSSRNSKRKWISPSLSVTKNVDWLLFTLSIWFEFETFTRGQRDALNSITDYLYIKQNNCDVHFCFNQGQKVGGHRNILAARSAVFEAMFQHDMKESNTGQVDIQDIQLDIFDQLLFYIYSGRLCTMLSVDSAQSLFVAANKYEIGDLKRECIDFLLSSFQVSNAINLMAWAHLHSVDQIKEAALTFASQHGKEICHLDEWLDLVKNYPELSVVATRRMIK